MGIWQALRYSLGNLASHKLRSALTMLGMLFGVGAVIAMLSIGAGAEQQALDTIESLGLRNILIGSRDFPDEELREIRKNSPGLSLRDARAIRAAVPGVSAVLPRIEMDPYSVISATGQSKPTVLGVPPGYFEAMGLRVAEGAIFGPEEEKAHAQVCIIGSRVRSDLFGHLSPVGRQLKVNDVWLTVMGVLEPESTTEREFLGVTIASTANQVFSPLSTVRRKFDHEPLADELSEILVVLQRGTDTLESALVIDDLLERLHGGTADYRLTVPQALLEQSRETQRLFNVVMGCIAGISLLVGGIGIMNIMLATVLERTGEIGIRRAVGAKKADIRSQFLVEAFSLSVVGGSVGVGLGIGIARGVAAFAGWTTIVTLSSVLLATLVSLTVGLVFGIYPAWRAANLDPIEALRHE